MDKVKIGRIVRVVFYSCRDEALEAAGLEGQAMSGNHGRALPIRRTRRQDAATGVLPAAPEAHFVMSVPESEQTDPSISAE